MENQSLTPWDSGEGESLNWNMRSRGRLAFCAAEMAVSRRLGWTNSALAPVFSI